MITSMANPRIRNVVSLRRKAKERAEQGVFLVEGIRMFREVPAKKLQEVYVSESFRKRPEHAAVLQSLGGSSGSGFETVSDAVFEKMADTRSPQGILAVVRMPEYRLEDLLGDGVPAGEISPGNARPWPPLLLILENLQDPGNLGTILRSAEGAGVTGILLGSGCVDLFSPKVIRSTMGSVFRMPFCYTQDLRGTAGLLKQKGVQLYAAHLKGTQSYTAMDYRGSCAFLIGNEGNGLTEETAALADAYVRIPMLGRVESLNASVAASLLVYEAQRQRL